MSGLRLYVTMAVAILIGAPMVVHFADVVVVRHERTDGPSAVAPAPPPQAAAALVAPPAQQQPTTQPPASPSMALSDTRPSLDPQGIAPEAITADDGSAPPPVPAPPPRSSEPSAPPPSDSPSAPDRY